MVNPVADVLLVAVGVAALWLGAVGFVGGATKVARALGVPGLIVGLTVVSFGTSAPEFAVTIDAALTGKAAVSLGNVVGSNVVNLGFILGGAALVRALPVSETLVRRDTTVMVASVLVLLVFLRDGAVSRVEGALLVTALAAYLVVLVRSGGERFQPAADPDAIRWFDPVRALVGLALIVAGAHALVTGSVGIATRAGVSEWVIGVTIVALGTSTPEFATSVVAARRGRTNVAAGNVVGSCVFNVFGVLGLATVIRPLSVGPVGFQGTLWLLGISVVVAALFWSRDTLSRAEGGLLVVLNAVDWVTDLVL
jgi:cation:H+ antiporter